MCFPYNVPLTTTQGDALLWPYGAPQLLRQAALRSRIPVPFSEKGGIHGLDVRSLAGRNCPPRCNIYYLDPRKLIISTRLLFRKSQEASAGQRNVAIIERYGWRWYFDRRMDYGSFFRLVFISLLFPFAASCCTWFQPGAFMAGSA